CRCPGCRTEPALRVLTRGAKPLQNRVGGRPPAALEPAGQRHFRGFFEPFLGVVFDPRHFKKILSSEIVMTKIVAASVVSLFLLVVSSFVGRHAGAADKEAQVK